MTTDDFPFASFSVGLAFSALALGTAFGCAQTETGLEPEPTVVRPAAIMGGEVDYSSKSVVGIYMQSGYSGGICSGSLIAPNMVLTAHHCVAELDSEYVICGETRFGTTYSPRSFAVTTDTTMGYSSRGYYDVRQVLVPEGNGSQVCGNDLAVLILSSNISSSVTTPIVPRIDAPVTRGERYSAVGYGHTGDGDGAGTRRRLDGLYAQCDGPLCPSYTGIEDNEWQGDDGTCQGDSGGPAIDLEGRVLGALSRGAEGCQFSLYTGVYRWSDWLREQGQLAADLGGYAPHMWVTAGVTEAPADDLDLDGVLNDDDNCPEASNPSQSDVDDDAIGDACDPDSDNDGTDDDLDNCPLDPNDDQKDSDNDEIGDVCDEDVDNDGVPNREDNCIDLANIGQDDSDGDGVGDVCDEIDGNDDEDPVVEDPFIDSPFVTKKNDAFIDAPSGGSSATCAVSAPGLGGAQAAGPAAIAFLLFGLAALRRR